MALKLSLAIAAALLAVSLVLGPRSCEGGIEWYLASGAIAFVAVSIILWKGTRPPTRTRQLLLGWAAVVAAWLFGIYFGDFQLLCRLF